MHCNLVCYEGFELANSVNLQVLNTNGLVWFKTISLVETTTSNHCRFKTNGGAVSNVSDDRWGPGKSIDTHIARFCRKIAFF